MDSACTDLTSAQNGHINGLASLSSIGESRQAALEQLKEKVRDLLLPYHTDVYMLRWLNDKEYDVKETEKKFRKHMSYRVKIAANNWDNYEIPKVIWDYGHTGCIGVDKDGDPVMLSMGGKIDIKGMASSLSYLDVSRVMFYGAEYILRVLTKPADEEKWYDRQISGIIDVKGLSPSYLVDAKILKFMWYTMRVYQEHFPGILKKVYMVNVPEFAHTFYNATKSFVDDYTVQRMKLYSDESYKVDLLEVIDENVLPAFLGGKRTDIDGNPNCNSLFQFKNKGTIPHSFYLSEDHLDIRKEQGIVHVVIKEGSSYVQQIRISKANSGIMWCFQTVGYNIKFGVYFISLFDNTRETDIENLIDSIIKGCVPEECEVIFPIKRVNSHIIPERGEIICKRYGTYVLHFDNTYSWVTPKTLLYKAEITLPAANKKGYSTRAANSVLGVQNDSSRTSNDH